MESYLVVEEISTDQGKTWLESDVIGSYIKKQAAEEAARKLHMSLNDGALRYRGVVIFFDATE